MDQFHLSVSHTEGGFCPLVWNTNSLKNIPLDRKPVSPNGPLSRKQTLIALKAPLQKYTLGSCWSSVTEGQVPAHFLSQNTQFRTSTGNLLFWVVISFHVKHSKHWDWLMGNLTWLFRLFWHWFYFLSLVWQAEPFSLSRVNISCISSVNLWCFYPKACKDDRGAHCLDWTGYH